MKISGEAKIVAGSALFALIPVGVKMSPQTGVQSLLFGRLLFASLFLLLIKKNRKEMLNIKRTDVLPLLLWAAIMCGAMLCYFYAIRSCGAALSSALLGIQPLFMILLAMLVLKENIRTGSIVAGILALSGVWLVTDLSGHHSKDLITGELLALSSALLLAFNFIFQKKFLGHHSSDRLVFYQSALQLPMLLPFLIIQSTQFTFGYIGASAMLGICCTVLAYLLIYKGASEVNAQKLGVLQSIEYVFPVLIGGLFYKEHLSLNNIIGILLIITACMVINIRGKGNSVKPV